MSALDPAAEDVETLADYIADLWDVGPDTPVDPRRPEYALAIVADAAPDDLRGYAETVFAALTAARTEVSAEQVSALDPGAVERAARAILRVRFGNAATAETIERCGGYDWTTALDQARAALTAARAEAPEHGGAQAMRDYAVEHLRDLVEDVTP